MDCTRTSQRSSWRSVVGIVIVLTLASGWLAAQARADGDPASDVLAVQSLFLPQDAGLPATQQAQLAQLLSAAGRAGYRLRVAVIASSADLGSVTELWRQPQTYARFLGQELSLIYRGRLLVVMPNGYGLDGVGGIHVDASALNALASPGTSLGPDALAAVRRLASAAGHPLALPTAGVSESRGSSEIVPWLVFALGLVLILAAWTLSIRARPLRAGTERGTAA